MSSPIGDDVTRGCVLKLGRKIDAHCPWPATIEVVVALIKIAYPDNIIRHLCRRFFHDTFLRCAASLPQQLFDSIVNVEAKSNRRVRRLRLATSVKGLLLVAVFIRWFASAQSSDTRLMRDRNGQ
jgi:hypothetical protein